MSDITAVLEYKCPSCGASLPFDQETQKMVCLYCDTEFDLEAVKAYNESLKEIGPESITWEEESSQVWTDEEADGLRSFTCPSCAGELITEDTTAATFCPYCGNATILPGRVSGSLKPDGVIPFKTGKDDAKAAFLNLCKGKPLLPKFFTKEQQIQKITGMYVPFWLYDCDSRFRGQYRATRVHRWSDSNYNYTKTDYYHVARGATAGFEAIPLDASTKMDNAIMESIEPFDYGQMVDFETAYLSGYLADKYDVEAKAGEDRIRQRVHSSMEDLLAPSMIGYTTVMPISKHLDIDHSKAKYVLFPVWMLTTKYRDKTYLFAMNGQTGKMTGTLPVCPKRTAAWFLGISAAVSAISALLFLLFA